jgi:hypothetical protein
MKPTVGRIIHCWPRAHDAPAGSDTLTCAALVTGVGDSALYVHYFLPHGENGSCQLPLEPLPEGSPPAMNRWWWPPRA